MRGGDVRTGELFSYIDLEDRVRRNHTLRAIRLIVNDALAALEGDFAGLYSPIGRPSIAPEKLLRAMLRQAFYSIRSERLLMERLEHDLLFRRFVGIGIDDAAWDHSMFSKNRDRLLEGDIAAKFLSAILVQPRVNEHFSVDGTLIEAWASMKSVKPKDEPADGPTGGSGAPPAGDSGRNAEADFHGEKRSSATHASTTDPDARLYMVACCRFFGHEVKLITPWFQSHWGCDRPVSSGGASDCRSALCNRRHLILRHPSCDKPSVPFSPFSVTRRSSPSPSYPKHCPPGSLNRRYRCRRAAFGTVRWCTGCRDRNGAVAHPAFLDATLP